jgi:protein involved in plasmid replication-relaxation
VHRKQRYNTPMPTATAPIKRLSRPEIVPPFRITERDIAILRAIAQFRFLSSQQVRRIVGGSERGLRNRLRNLFSHGYLDRPPHQRAELAAFLNPPLVYGLGKYGARFLADLGRPIDHRLDWTTKNTRATSPFLAHTIEVAETMMAFTSACRAEVAPELADHHELLPFMPQQTRDARDPYSLRVKFRHRSQDVAVAVVPDRLFALHFSDGRQFNFALELDRGTMDVAAKRLVGKSSFCRKILAYFHAWQDKRHTSVWGFESFRVLTVTTSEERIDHMFATQHDVAQDLSARPLFVRDTGTPGTARRTRAGMGDDEARQPLVAA